MLPIQNICFVQRGGSNASRRRHGAEVGTTPKPATAAQQQRYGGGLVGCISVFGPDHTGFFVGNRKWFEKPFGPPETRRRFRRGTGGLHDVRAGAVDVDAPWTNSDGCFLFLFLMSFAGFRERGAPESSVGRLIAWLRS
jgi:hypothetical protein